MGRIVGWVLLAFLVLTTTSVTFAQLPTGTILGVVRDSSGGVVPDAAVTIRNTDTGFTRTLTTGEDGAFRAPALPVGQYSIKVEKTGFQVVTRTGLTLEVGQELVSNATLQVGSSTQEVVVSGEAPVVNTTNGVLGSLVNEEKIDDLPLNGRNYIDLTLLQPGITQHRNIGANPTSGGLWYSSNGAPVRSNNYLLDGAPMVTLLGANSSSLAGTTLGIDGIREYRVLTNAFSAEYGMTMGSQVMIVSKGGTNNWHGDVFEYLRNNALDARNFFDPLDTTNANGFGTDKSLVYPGKRLPPFQRNDFGGSFGGPIRKDKTFFYAVYEGLRQRLGETIIDNVMAAGCHGPAGAVIWNGVAPAPPTYHSTCPQIGGTTSTTVTIPSVIAPLLAIYPNPNLPGNQFTYPDSAPTREDFGQIRVDHTFSAKDSLFARYTIDDAQVITPVSTAAGLQSYPGYTVVNNSRSQYITVSEDHIFSTVLLNTARISFSRTSPRNASDSPFTGSQYAFIPDNNTDQLGNINIGGVSGLGPHVTTPAYLPQNIFTYSDDVFYTRGRHSLKFGTLINRFQLYDETSRGYRGTVIFGNIAAFLAGHAARETGLTPSSIMPTGVRIDARNYRFTTLGFYGQDDFRVSSRLTLNLGLRYEFMTQFHEKDGYQSAFPNLQTDSAPTVGIPFQNPTKRNVSPRVGFAWDVKGDGKTSVRGGFALLYDLSTYGTALNVIQPNWQPFSSGSTIAPIPPAKFVNFAIPFLFTSANIGNTVSIFDYNLQQPHLLSYNLTVERQLPFSMGLSVAYAGSRGINILGTRDGNPRIPGGIPQGGACVTPSSQLSLSAVDLTSMVDGSATACWAAPATSNPNPNPFVNPNFPASISLITSPASSFYNSLQVLLTKRLARGLQFQSSYTFSKLIDDPQAEATQVISSGPVQPTDAFNRATDHGLSAYDVAHNWRFNAIYQLPQLTGRTGVLPKLVNGWQVSTVVSVQTGYPFTINMQQNRSRSGAFQSLTNLDRPDLAPGRSIYSITHGTSPGCGIPASPGYIAPGTPLGTPNLWFDPCAFTIPAAGFLGNAGRNILRGPGLSNVDFSVVKDTAIRQLGESGHLEFRAEMFNVFNHPNFALPSLLVYSASASAESPLVNAGQITSTGGATSRQIQLALKLMF
jgi:hypothetical protein